MRPPARSGLAVALAVCVLACRPTTDPGPVALRRGTVTDFDGSDGRAFGGDRDGNGVDDTIVNIAGNDVSGFAVTRITAALPCPP